MKQSGQKGSGVRRAAGNGQQRILGVRQAAGNGRRVASEVNFTSKGKHSEAVWAMTLYERLGHVRRVHIRRLHYMALLQDGLTLPSGRAYRNTTADFEYLKNSFERARLLGLVPYDVFSENCGFAVDGGLRGLGAQRRVLLKRMIEQACRRHIRNSLASFTPVHIEIWLERTGAADVVASLVGKYNLKLVASEGDISLTSIWHFVRRLGNISKPVRILYICDFQQGVLRPGAAEKVFAVLDQYGLSRTVDLKVLKLALSKDDCAKYDLPAAPEVRMGPARLTELHALEAAAPGFLCETLEKQINRYIDPQSLRDAETKADRSIERLLIKINRVIDGNMDVYETFQGN